MFHLYYNIVATKIWFGYLQIKNSVASRVVLRGREVLGKQKIKKICFILFVLLLICLLFKYRKIIAIIVSRYYFAVNTSLGKVLLNAIVICVGSLLSIIVCWIVGKCRDKKIINGGPFSNRYPRLNTIIGLALVIIIVSISY